MRHHQCVDREISNTSDPATTVLSHRFDHRLTRRDLLVRAGQAALGTAALSIAGLPRAAAAIASTPVTLVGVFDAGVATRWYDLALDLVRDTPGFSPPVAARAFGYLGVTLYEALVPGMDGYQSLAGQLNGLLPLDPPRDHSYHWPIVANSSLAAIARRLLPATASATQSAIDTLETKLAQSFAGDVSHGIYRRSVERGRAVAEHIFAWSMLDGGHAGYLTNFPTDYTPPVGSGLWVPTPPAFQRAMQPDWGQNRPFVLADGAFADPGPPSTFSTEPDSAFYAEALEVYEAVNNLTDEQRDIALFWSDDPGLTPTPAGHSISIMTQTLKQRGESLDVAAEAYAKAGLAVSDAFISCWHSKFTYNLLRPITYIQEHIDSGWGGQMPLTTPPFPEYPSGHSVQTGAFAQVLFDLFGDFRFTDHTHDGRGLAPRSFTSCFEMASETAISRLYGGIHYRSAIERGVDQGQQIGRLVSALPFRR